MPPKATTKIPFTFGVELEFVFATDEPSFRKFPTYLPPLTLSNSTLLKALEKKAKTSENARAIDRVSRILNRSGLTVKPQLVPHFAGDYSQWQVTYDASVRLRMARMKVVDHVRDFAASIAKISNTKGWGTSGVELVPRVLPLPTSRADASLEEVGAYVGALGIRPELEDPWLAVGKVESAGLHLHIGVAPGSKEGNEIPLPVLQELGFLLAKYEDLISFLHGPSRRVGRTGVHRAMLNSNLIGFGCAHGLCRALDGIRGEIFAPGMTINKLATLMSRTGSRGKGGVTSRFKIVNFENMIDHSGKNIKTLEFRQHSGTLNAEEINQWVWFLTRLMRTAEALATRGKKGTSCKSRKAVASSQTRLEVLTELMHLIVLDSDAQTYWRNRLCREDPKDAGEVMTDDVCLRCTKAKSVGGKSKRVKKEEPVEAARKRVRHSYALRSMTSRTVRLELA